MTPFAADAGDDATAARRSAGASRLFLWCAWAALLAPAWLLAWTALAIHGAYSPTPYSDQWVQIAAMRVTPPGGWLAYLFSQHNEHRILVSRLVFLADWNWFQGRNALNLAVIGLIQLSGVILFAHAALSRRPRALAVLGLAAAASLLVSLLQWENLFWGFQVCFVAVYAAGAWAIYLYAQATSGERVRWGRLAAALALLVVATFSMANGLFAGVAMALMGLLSRKRGAAILAAGAATAVLLAVYLHGYQRLDSHASLAVAPQHPGRFITYVAIFLGNLWVPGLPQPSALIGFVGVAATLGMLVVLLRRDETDPVRSALFGIALFVGMSAMVTSLGRLILGVEQAMSSRYMTPTAYFWAAHAVFWTLTFQRDPPASRGAARLISRLWGPARLILTIALVLVLWRVASLQRLGEAQLVEVSGRVRSATSALLGGFDRSNAVRDVYPDPAHVASLTPSMRAARKSLFVEPPLTSAGARFQVPLAARAGACRGAFDGLAPDASGLSRAVGWGWDETARRAFARVVIVDDAGKVLGVGLSGQPRPDVAKAVREVHGASGWLALTTPAPGREVIAYGITASGQACEIGRKAPA